MTAELPEEFHDPVARSRVARLHSEVQRLAHSSPPVVGRDARIRELKAAVAILSDYQFGFSNIKWCLAIYRRLAAGLVVSGIAVLLLTRVLSGKLPTLSDMLRFGGYLLLSVVAVGVWDFLNVRRRLRMAEALADSLAVGRRGTSAKAHG